MIKRNDALWKSILETVFGEFLLFFYGDAGHNFDFSKGFIYLDKELDQLFPPDEGAKGVRYVDKLVKVFLKDGSEKYILVHVEIQSQKGKGDLGARMFTYFYRVREKYGVPITAIAILADGNRNYRPSVYKEEVLGTRLTYEFNSYKIMDQEERVLRADSNPFAVVVLTSLLAIRNKNMDDEQLKDIKHDLYREMVRRKIERKKRKGIYDFLTYFVRFKNREMLRIFEKELLENQGERITMGTREFLIDQAKKEERSKERAKAEKRLEREKKLLSEQERAKAEKRLEREKKLLSEQERAKAEKRLERERAKTKSENHKRAVKMIKSGVDVQLIADIFDIPIEEVKKLE